MANPRRHPTILEHSIFRKIKRNWGENGAAHRGKQSAISIYFQLFELLFGGVGFFSQEKYLQDKTNADDVLRFSPRQGRGVSKTRAVALVRLPAERPANDIASQRLANALRGESETAHSSPRHAGMRHSVAVTAPSKRFHDG